MTRPVAGMTEGDLIEQIVGQPLNRVFAVRHSESEWAAAEHAPPVLEVSRLRGGPLVDVSFKAYGGEILGVAGLLGSGRTELLRMIFGAHPLEGGEIRVAGVPVAFQEPQEAMAAGVAHVPESRELGGIFQGLSVAQNLSIGQLSRYWNGWRYNHRREQAEARESWITDVFNGAAAVLAIAMSAQLRRRRTGAVEIGR